MKDLLAKLNLEELRREDIPKLLLQFITSYGLAAVILVLLTLITLFGTLNQAEESLFDSQKKYFESFWVVDQVGSFPVFLPGGYLLMAVLFVNILAGTIIKIRRNPKNVGLYMVHVGILLLIAGGFVTKHYSWEGNMALYPGMKASEALSYHHWQLEIVPVDADGKAKEALVIPHHDLHEVGWNGQARFVSDQLPFEIVVERLARNSIPVPAGAPVAAKAEGKAIDGYVLLPQSPAEEAEANTAGAYVKFVPKQGGNPIEAILWGHVGGNFAPMTPFSFEVAGKKYAAQIVRERLSMPFAIRLDEFKFDKYAGVATAKNYQSNVTKIEDGVEESIEIKMNEPLRHMGYTFFQASFGPANARDGEELYTVLAVVKNPSDHWPLVSLIIVMIGMLIHLGVKQHQSSRRSAKAKEPAPAAAAPAQATGTAQSPAKSLS